VPKAARKHRNRPRRIKKCIFADGEVVEVEAQLRREYSFGGLLIETQLLKPTERPACIHRAFICPPSITPGPPPVGHDPVAPPSVSERFVIASANAARLAVIHRHIRQSAALRPCTPGCGSRAAKQHTVLSTARLIPIHLGLQKAPTCKRTGPQFVPAQESLSANRANDTAGRLGLVGVTQEPTQFALFNTPYGCSVSAELAYLRCSVFPISFRPMVPSQWL